MALALSRRTKMAMAYLAIILVVLYFGGANSHGSLLHPLTVQNADPTEIPFIGRFTRGLYALNVHSDHWRSGGSPTGALGPPFRLKVFIH